MKEFDYVNQYYGLSLRRGSGVCDSDGRFDDFQNYGDLGRGLVVDDIIEREAKAKTGETVEVCTQPGCKRNGGNES